MAGNKKKTAGRIKRILLSIVLIGLMTCAICAVAFALYVNRYINPNVDIDLSSYGMDFTSIIYYQDKETEEFIELEKLHGAENRIWADFDEIPQALGEAFVAIEDQRFYSHKGVDWKRTFGAVVNWAIPFRSSLGGGSTITQQLIKNMTDDNDYSVKRKITEILRALHLEQKLGDKDRILELYMNTIYLGRNSYGVRTAALTYFDKDLEQLNLAECALLAGITNNPSKYDPFRHPDNAKKRQELILSNMLKQEKISQQEYDEALSVDLVYKTAESKAEDSEPYSYFVDTVIRDVTNDLIAEKGYSRQYADTLVRSGGLKIYATVDMKIQSIMEEVYNDDDNFPSYKKNGASLQSGMAIIDPYTGDLVGVVGGRNPSEKASLDLNRATQSKLSPGSSIKPVSVYGPAIDLGVITPYTIYEDSPFMQIDGRDWPRNENRRYTGNMTVQTGIAKSVNTVAVKILDDVTPEKSYEYLTEKLGFSNITKDDINYSPLALGSCSTTVRELANAYIPFVNDGMYIKSRSYTKVVDANDGILLSNQSEPTIAFENEKTSYIMTSLLTNAVTNGTGASARLSNMPTAGKTGTTSSNKDRWFVGYTPYYVGAVWVGYDEAYGLPNMSYNPSARAWKRVMSRIHEDLPRIEFPSTDTYIKVEYCIETGLLPTDGCTTAVGKFYKGDEPTKICPGNHKKDEPDEEDPIDVDPETPSDSEQTPEPLPTEPENPETPETPQDNEHKPTIPPKPTPPPITPPSPPDDGGDSEENSGEGNLPVDPEA